MQDIFGLLANPKVLKLLGILFTIYWLLMAAVDAWAEPNPADHSRWYCYSWRFAHGLAANVKRAATALKVPGA